MTLEERTRDLVAALNGMTFSDEDDNAEYVRKITLVVRSSLRAAIAAERAKWLDALEAIAMMQAKEECSLAAEMRKTALAAIAS